MIEAPVREHPSLTKWLVDRWPTWLGIGFALLIGSGLSDPRDLSFLLVVLVLGYVVPAVLGRRDAAWWVAIGATVLVTAAKIAEVDETTLLLGAAAVAVIVGAIRRPRDLRVQVAAGTAFVVIALVASTLNPTIGGALIAAGLFGHAGWDVYHHHTDKVVVRSYAEWCAVLDSVLGVAVVVAIL